MSSLNFHIMTISIYTIFVGYSANRDNEIRKKKFNARRRFTPKEDAVLNVLEQMEIPGRVHPNQANVQDSVRVGPFEGQRLATFQTAFPQCEMIPWLVIMKYFYIYRYHYVTGPLRTVHFVASGRQLFEAHRIRNDQQLNLMLGVERWFGRATCRNGEITEVVTAGRFQTGTESSAKQCGFASSLIYLCLSNVEHFNHFNGQYRRFVPQGYAVNQSPMFRPGNMPHILRGLIQPYCRRVIYVNYRVTFQPDSPLFPQENIDMTSYIHNGLPNVVHKGSKAFIYAAQAAGYDYMITFNLDPCQQGCCKFRVRKSHRPSGEPIPFPNVGPEVTDNPHGKVYEIHRMLSSFNIFEPASVNIRPNYYSENEPAMYQTRDFVNHNGRHWFFCIQNPV